MGWADEIDPREPFQHRKSRLPGWFHDALDLAEKEQTCVVVILVPPDPKDRSRLEASLNALLSDPPYEVAEALAEAIYVCADPSWVDSRKGETLLLLNARGERAAGSKAAVSPETFAEELHSLLRGEGRLEARTRRERTTKVDQALKDLASGDFPVRDAAERFLVEHFRSCAGAVIATRLSTPDEEVRARCRSVVEEFMRKCGVPPVPDATTGEKSPLLYGVSLERQKVDACEGCGRSSAPKHSRALLRLLVR